MNEMKNDIVFMQRISMARYKFLNDFIRLYTFENYKGDRTYLLLADNQLIYRVPYGAGGTVWPNSYKVIEIVRVGNKFPLSFPGNEYSRDNRSNQLWTVKSIESLEQLICY